MKYILGFFWYIVVNLLSFLWHFNFKHTITFVEALGDHSDDPWDYIN